MAGHPMMPSPVAQDRASLGRVLRRRWGRVLAIAGAACLLAGLVANAMGGDGERARLETGEQTGHPGSASSTTVPTTNTSDPAITTLSTAGTFPPGPTNPENTVTTPQGPDRQFIRFDAWEVPWTPRPHAIGATSSSGLPVNYSIIGTENGSCELSGDLLVARPQGLPMSCSVRASQPGDGTWLPAEPVDRVVVLGPGRSKIEFMDGYPKRDGDQWIVGVDDTNDVSSTVTFAPFTSDICSVDPASVLDTSSVENVPFTVNVHRSGQCELKFYGGGSFVYSNAPTTLSFDVEAPLS